MWSERFSWILSGRVKRRLATANRKWARTRSALQATPSGGLRYALGPDAWLRIVRSRAVERGGGSVEAASGLAGYTGGYTRVRDYVRAVRPRPAVAKRRNSAFNTSAPPPTRWSDSTWGFHPRALRRRLAGWTMCSSSGGGDRSNTSGSTCPRSLLAPRPGLESACGWTSTTGAGPTRRSTAGRRRKRTLTEGLLESQQTKQLES